MSFLNHSARELNFKVVYCGPELAGKKTSYQYVRSKFPPKRDVLFVQSTLLGRTDYFDFVPPGLGELRGFKSRIHLYVLLEHVASENTRLLMLRGVDGVIFVADSQRQCAEDNLWSLEEMESNLVDSGYDPAKLPRVYSYNKRDLPDALPVEEMEKRLNPQPEPVELEVAPLPCWEGLGEEERQRAVRELAEGVDAEARAGGGPTPHGSRV